MRVGRRVYVSNLAWRTSWQDLKDHFRTAGEVVYSNVIKDADGACCCKCGFGRASGEEMDLLSGAGSVDTGAHMSST